MDILEARIAHSTRLMLSGCSVGEMVGQATPTGDIPEWYDDVVNTMENFLPTVIGELHPEFGGRPLDGVYASVLRKDGPLQVSMIGSCIFIDGQDLASLYLRWKVAPDRDAFEWFHCSLGELDRNQKMIRYPYKKGPLMVGFMVADRLDKIRWRYSVEFGDVPPVDC